jgi:hypothetical protein
LKFSPATHPIRYRVTRFALIIFVLAGQWFISEFSAHSSQTRASTSASIAGCPLFPANNIWNYDISKLPTDPHSADYIHSFRNDLLQVDFGRGTWGFPYVVVPGSQPYVPIHFTKYPADSDPGPYPIPPNAPIQQGSDAHVLVLDRGTCKLYELWQGSPQPDGSWNAGGGAIFDLTSNALRPLGKASADAAGLPILPGLVRYDEVATGVITHALRFAGPNPQNTFLWPARHTDGPSNSLNSLPEGARLRLKASVNISSFSPRNQIILTALKHYGMFLADNGGKYPYLALSGAPDSRWSDNDLSALSRIPPSDFEVVDESSLQAGSNSGRVLVSQALPTTTSTSLKAPSPATYPTSIALTHKPVEETTGNEMANILLFALGSIAILLPITVIWIKSRGISRASPKH